MRPLAEFSQQSKVSLLTPPPDPPLDIEKRRGIGSVFAEGEAEPRRAGRANQTSEPIEPPWQAIREWIPADEGKTAW